MSSAFPYRRARLSAALAAQAAAAAPSSNAKLEVANLLLHPVREPASQHAYSIVELRTREGIAGFGEGPPVSAADFALARQFWTGRPASSYAAAPPGPLAGAIDMALLDAVGKASKAPVYRLLGGPTRNQARAFTSLGGATAAERGASLDRAVSAGFRAFGVPLARPAARNQGQAYQRDLRQMLEALRAARPSFEFVLEAGGALTPGDAASVAATVESLHPLWFDEPCAVSSPQTIRKVAEESVVPLGFGRDIADPGVYQELLREGLIDVVRPDMALAGITAVRRIAALAEPYYTAVAPRHSGGPIATAAALHLAACIPNFFIQYIPLPEAREDARMREDLAGQDVERVRDGFAALPTGPGLGVSVSAAALEKYHAA